MKERNTAKGLLAALLGLIAAVPVSGADLLGQFDKERDLYLAHFDLKTDVDDIHSVATVATLLADHRLEGISYHAVAGAYGSQGGLYVPANDLFDLAFGKHWSDAHADRDKAVREVSRISLQALNAGGSIWIAEGGQSDFSAALVRELQARLPGTTLKDRIHIVQHADWNEKVTTPEDLEFVRREVSYHRIPDGNTAGNGTPDFRRDDVIDWRKHLTDERLTAIWNKAIAIADTYNGADGRYLNESIKRGGLDFSDAAETTWIFGFNDLSTAEEFFAFLGSATDQAEKAPSADPDYAQLRVGFAVEDITPASDVSLGGYGFRAGAFPPGNAGVHDPLKARAFVLRDHQRVALLVSLDLPIISTSFAREMRARLAEELGTTTDHIILSCTHTHSAPFLMTEADARDWNRPWDPANPTPAMRYTDRVREAVLLAARRAEALTYPADVWIREAPFALAYNRRAMTERGLVSCWEPQQFPNRQPGIPEDVTCSVLVFRQKGGPRSYVLWSIGAHATVLGKTSRLVSADYPGLANELIEASIPGARSLFLQGASGETQPWIATQEDPGQLKPVAAAAASFVSLLSQAGRPVQIKYPWFECRSETVTIGTNELDITVWKLGEVWLVALPVELFSSLSKQLREQIEGEVVLATLSNGHVGYFPAETDFPEGGYEVDAANHQAVQPGHGELLVRKVVELTRKFQVR